MSPLSGCTMCTRIKDKPRVKFTNKESKEPENIVMELPGFRLLQLIQYTGN